jgi:AraC-like DNA-binding protein
MVQTNGSNGSNGRSTQRLLESERTVRDFTGRSPRDDGRSHSYAAVLVIGPLTDDDIADFARAGRTVKTFLEIDESLAALVLGRPRETEPQPRESPRTEPLGQVPDNHAGAVDRVRGISQEQVSTHDGVFASEISTQLDPLLPTGPIRELFRLSARKTRKKLTVLQAAEAIGVEREKLTAMLREAGFPSPNEVIRQHRLLHAAWLLGRTPKRTVEEIATALGFASGAVLTHAMRTSMGAAPTKLEERGGFRLALAQFRRTLQGSRPNESREQPPAST